MDTNTKGHGPTMADWQKFTGVAPEAAPVAGRRGARGTAKPRTKVTAEDVEARVAGLLSDRRTRKAARAPRSMRTLVRASVATAMGIGIIGFGLGISSENAQHAADMRAGQTKQASLEGALAAVDPETGKDTPQKLTTGLAAARKLSDSVASSQQDFAAIAFAGNADAVTSDGRPAPATLKSLEHRKALAAFFAPEALLLTDAQAYSFRTNDLLGPGRIDPRQPWFVRYEAATATGGLRPAADPKTYSWQTASVSLSGTPGVMSVVWTNTDTATGELLAWATARYSTETNTLRNLTVTLTTRGDSQQLKPHSTSAAPAAAKGA